MKIQLNANIDEKVMNDFRDAIYRKTGLHKGDITKQLEKALKEYVETHKRKK